MKLTKNINLLKKKEFLSIFGNIFEKSDWIADEVFNLKPFKNSNDLVIKMMDVYENINNEEMIKIFNSHPQLAIEKRLTSFSSKEQTGAKLNECSKEEFEEFEKLNADYKKKYGFPFIIAVKGKNKEEILNNFRQRINNNIEFEFEESKKQVKKIALFRLDELFTK